MKREHVYYIIIAMGVLAPVIYIVCVWASNSAGKLEPPGVLQQKGSSWQYDGRAGGRGEGTDPARCGRPEGGPRGTGRKPAKRSGGPSRAASGGDGDQGLAEHARDF